jgi:hypothetical protein
MSNSLFTFVTKEVKDEIQNRISDINSYSGEAIARQHGKVAYATVKGESITLGTNVDNDKLYNKDNNYLPHATLSNVKITNEGQFGSLRKASFSYTIYNKDQLDYYEKDFMIPAKAIEIFYGWSNKNYDPVNTGKYKGFVYNFGYDVGDDGSFNCTCETVGEGYFITGLNLNAEIKNPKTSKDEKETKLLVNNIFTLIDYNTTKAFQENPTAKYYPKYNLAKFPLLKETSHSANEPSTTGISNTYDKTPVIGKTKPNWYIELKGFVNLINTELLPDMDIKVSIDAISYYDRYVKSANPSEFVFPDKYMGKYSKDITYNIDNNFRPKDSIGFQNPDKNETIDFGCVLISINFIKQIIEDINKDSEVDGLPIKSFFTKIFDSIRDNTGGYYNYVSRLLLLCFIRQSNNFIVPLIYFI